MRKYNESVCVSFGDITGFRWMFQKRFFIEYIFIPQSVHGNIWKENFFLYLYFFGNLFSYMCIDNEGMKTKPFVSHLGTQMEQADCSIGTCKGV